MRVLIVGCGYLGMALGRELARQGHAVSGLRRNPAAAGLDAAGIRPLAGDITQPDTLTGLPSSYDWVVHCVSTSGGGADEYRRLYWQGTRNLVDWLAGVPLRKLVYTSSTSVYGQDDGSVVDEGSVVAPAAETAKVLVQTEQVLFQAAKQERFPAVVLRVAGIYGPGRTRWLERYLEGGHQTAGDRLVNMIHCDDVVGAVIVALQHGQPGEVYNAVDNEPVTQAEIAAWLAQTLGQRPAPEQRHPTRATGKRAVTNKRVSNRRLREELRYNFKYPTFREGYGAELKRKAGRTE